MLMIKIKELKKQIAIAVDHALTESFLHHIADEASSKRSKEELLDAIMAACALVSEERVALERMDSSYLLGIYHQYNLLKHFDHQRGEERFEFFRAQIEADKDSGTELAYIAIEKIKKSDHKSHIVLAICSGLNYRSESEEVMVQKIADLLGIKNDIEAITNKIGLKGSY